MTAGERVESKCMLAAAQAPDVSDGDPYRGMLADREQYAGLSYDTAWVFEPRFITKLTEPADGDLHLCPGRNTAKPHYDAFGLDMSRSPRAVRLEAEGPVPGRGRRAVQLPPEASGRFPGWSGSGPSRTPAEGRP
jgi:hypothetical protein